MTLSLSHSHLKIADINQLGGFGPPGEYVTLTVTDNGMGIAPEVRKRIFEPFFTTKPKGKGTGLGLPTVVRLMQLHGGFLNLDSIPSAGTTVSCHFPVVPGKA